MENLDDVSDSVSKDSYIFINFQQLHAYQSVSCGSASQLFNIAPHLQSFYSSIVDDDAMNFLFDWNLPHAHFWALCLFTSQENPSSGIYIYEHNFLNDLSEKSDIRFLCFLARLFCSYCSRLRILENPGCGFLYDFNYKI